MQLFITGSVSLQHKPPSHLPPSDSSQALTAHVSYQATNPRQPWACPVESGSTNPGVSPRSCSPFLSGLGRLQDSRSRLLDAPTAQPCRPTHGPRLASSCPHAFSCNRENLEYGQGDPGGRSWVTVLFSRATKQTGRCPARNETL